MSRKSGRQFRRSSGRLMPTILNRKRKSETEDDLERELRVSKRREDFQTQNCWVPIPEKVVEVNNVEKSDKQEWETNSERPLDVGCTEEVVTKLEESEHTLSEELVRNGHKTPSEAEQNVSTWSRFRGLSCIRIPVCDRLSPLPILSWANPSEVWQLMCKKDIMYKREKDVLSSHPSLQARMRSILLDWLIEVCEVYRLHRETYYLGLDFIDRFLVTQENIPKEQLQLIGITCLFISSKIEEIYPPKLSEFSYVTDGACTESEILNKELVILKALNWDLSPVTANGWLNIFLQLANMDPCQDQSENFVFPQYSSLQFVQTVQVIDLCMLDVGCLQFPYSVIAASAFYHMSSEKVALTVSGYKWCEIAPCVQWMSAFALTVREAGLAQLRSFQQVMDDDIHNIQTHTVDLQLLEKAQARLQQVLSSLRSSPVLGTPGMLTPPQSGEKPQPVNVKSGEEDKVPT